VRTISDKEFQGLKIRDQSAVIGPIRLERCHLDHCGARGWKVDSRPVFRSCELIAATERRCSVGGVVFDEVLVDGLQTDDLLFIWGCAFRHVVLRGRVGRLLLSQLVSPLPEYRALAQAFLKANAEFYRNIDWALDLTELEGDEVDIRCIPGALVRRNPKTQAAITLTRATELEAKWRKIEFSGTCFRTALENMLALKFTDEVLVASKYRRKYDFNREIEVLQRLRDIGVAE
jgi:hypothetical protein